MATNFPYVAVGLGSWLHCWIRTQKETLWSRYVTTFLNGRGSCGGRGQIIIGPHL